MNRCRALLQQIPASDITQVFGSGGADVDVELPQTYTDRKSIPLLIQPHVPAFKTIDVPS